VKATPAVAAEWLPIMPLNALLVTSDALALSLALSAKGLAVF
jgi:hypothetical protein